MCPFLKDELDRIADYNLCPWRTSLGKIVVEFVVRNGEVNVISLAESNILPWFLGQLLLSKLSDRLWVLGYLPLVFF